MCVSVEVKGRQDALSFAVGAFREHKGVGAPHTHFPSHQSQRPGQSSMAQSGDFNTITTGYHDDGRKKWDGGNHEPHYESCKGD